MHIIPCCETDKETYQIRWCVVWCFLEYYKGRKIDNKHINNPYLLQIIFLQWRNNAYCFYNLPICFRIASRILQTIKRLSIPDSAASILLKGFVISLLNRIGIAIALAMNPSLNVAYAFKAPSLCFSLHIMLVISFFFKFARH